MMFFNWVFLYNTLLGARYVRLLLDCIQLYAYFQLDPFQNEPEAPIPPPREFSVISVTLGAQEGYIQNVQSWLDNDIAAVIAVTIDENASQLRALTSSMKDPRVHVYSVPEMGWRPSGVEGIRRTSTPYLIFVDDDVVWGNQTLNHIAQAFANPAVGGVNTMQEVHPHGSQLTTWESFGALNLVRRNILHSFLAYFRDGELLNLSGRTAGYRTNILQSEQLFYALTHEYWRGRHLLTTGDDNLFTSWVVRQGWKTRFLSQTEATVATQMNVDKSYLKQLMRWSRDTARAYLKDLSFAIRERRVSYLTYCAFKIVANYASDWAIMFEVGILLVLVAKREKSSNKEMTNVKSDKERLVNKPRLPDAKRLWRDHVLVVGAMQIFEHIPFFVDIRNLVFIPGAILYAYIHALAVIWAMLTLNTSLWGSRPGMNC